MSSSRNFLYTLFACVPILLAGCGDADTTTSTTSTTSTESMPMATGNPISGEGMPNPAPIVTKNWGDLQL